MVNSIDQALVTQFTNDVHVEASQKKTRLRGRMLEKPVTGNDAAYERIDDGGTANELTARHQPTVGNELLHSRRQIKMRDFENTFYLDQFDDKQVLINAGSEYAKASVNKMFRTIDKLLIDAAVGTVNTGKNFGTPVTFANDGGTTITAGSTGMTYEKLLQVKENFINNEVDVEDGGEEEILLLVTGQQYTDMMKQVELTSGDFRREAVVESGRLISALGMKVITFGTANNFLNKTGSTRDCLAMSTRAVCLGINKDISVRMNERPDQNNDTQIQTRMFMGATRTEGKLIQKVQCTEV
jgi:hypothetical protein